MFVYLPNSHRLLAHYGPAMATILIIHDNSSLRAMIEDILTGVGHQVDSVTNGDDGVARYRANPSEIIICDLFMPKKQGVKAVAALRKINEHVQILAISGMASILRDQNLPIAERFDSVRILSRPFQPAALLRLIDEMVAIYDLKKYKCIAVVPKLGPPTYPIPARFLARAL
jgi:CheY-like chemotaxis protein